MPFGRQEPSSSPLSAFVSASVIKDVDTSWTPSAFTAGDHSTTLVAKVVDDPRSLPRREFRRCPDSCAPAGTALLGLPEMPRRVALRRSPH